MSREELINLIAHYTCEVIPDLSGHLFEPDDRLAELGANSVDRAEIAMMVQESLSLTIPRVELFGPKNIGELADLFLRKLDAA